MSDLTQSSFVCSDHGQNSTIRFAGSIIGSLGMPLRDGPLEDDDECTEHMVVADYVECGDLSENDKELHASHFSDTVDVIEEHFVESKKILAHSEAQRDTAHFYA